MEKVKLIEKRKLKGLSQSEVAKELCMEVTAYCRREKGKVKIAYPQWEKLAEILGVPVDDIYESEENQVFICKDNATGNYYQGSNNNQGTNSISSIPEYLLETQRKYIETLEKKIQVLDDENQELRQRLEKLQQG